MNWPACSVADAATTRPPVRHTRPVPLRWLSVHSLRNGLIGAAAMAAFYVTVVSASSGSWQHLADQSRHDWIYLTAIIAGFATQVTLTSEIRQRHRHASGAMATGAAGAGASTAGMVACCAHHLADLLPLVGAATAAGFLTDYRTQFMLVGITINASAVLVAGLQLHRIHRSTGRC